MAELQVFGVGEAFCCGQTTKVRWNRGLEDNASAVPPGHFLEVTSLTCGFNARDPGLPVEAAAPISAAVGRLVVSGVEHGTAIWLVTVFVRPQTTVHLTFPKALRLQPRGHVECVVTDVLAAFGTPEPRIDLEVLIRELVGLIRVDANGVLVKTEGPIVGTLRKAQLTLGGRAFPKRR